MAKTSQACLVKNRLGLESLSLVLSGTLLTSIFAIAGLSILPSYVNSADASTFPGTNGKIVFYSLRHGGGDNFVINPDGTGEKRLTFFKANDFPSWSPDGKKIIFSSIRDGNYEIYVMNADGSNQTRITNNTVTDTMPTWSPDGKKVAFSREGRIHVMNADGSGQEQLTTGYDYDPEWSPDGKKIMFVGQRPFFPTGIYVMNADGSGQTLLHPNANGPSWSPDGKKIAFSDTFDIFVSNSDGTDKVRLTYDQVNLEPSWSPDGKKIAFESQRDTNAEIYVMDADGSNQTRVTNNPGNDHDPDWGVDIPAPTPPDTKIAKAKDSFADSIKSGSSTLSTSMTFAFKGISSSSVSVSGFECKLDDALAFTSCTSPITYTNLSYGRHTFNVKAVDVMGNADPTPSIWTWSVLTPAQGIQKLLNRINALEDVDNATKASLLASLKAAKTTLSDGNLNNDNSVCGKLQAFLKKVDEKERNRELTLDQSAKLRKLAAQIMSTIGCS